MPSVQIFPFGPGLHEENDQRLQNAGTPRAVENLIRTKNGRLRPRRDYETLGMTAQSGVSALRLYDLHSYGSRLLGFGRCTTSVMQAYATDACADIFELVEETVGTWRKVPQSELVAGTQARFIARTGRKPSGITRLDVAAGNGLVCIVYELILRPDIGGAPSTGVMVVRAEDDATILTADISTGTLPRVAFFNGVFLIGTVTSGGGIQLHRYDPATSSALVLVAPDPVATGSSIVAWDMGASVATGASGNTLWIASAKANTTTQIRGCSSAGAVTYTAAGPAVLGDFISILHHDTGGTERFHVCIVRDTTLNVDLYTYLPPSTSPATSTTDLLTPFDGLCQPALALYDSTRIYVATQINSVGQQLLGAITNFSTHAISVFPQLFTSFMNAKALNVRGRVVTAMYTTEEVGFFTHCLVRVDDTLAPQCYRAVTVVDRFLGHELDRAHLPSIAFDASTGKTYWVVSTEDNDRVPSPQVLELVMFGTERRQTVQLGDVLYIAGSVLQAFDGRAAQEAGGFLTRPFISSTTLDVNGALELDGIYQFIATYEFRDAKNRRVQSAPSNLVERAMGGGFDSVNVFAEPSLTLRDSGLADIFTATSAQGSPLLVIYRTLDTNDGNGTFHLDVTEIKPRTSLKARGDAESVQSDTDLSDNAILYTQGARGALSGPLEFVCPDPCVSLAASADRILSGGLPDETLIQESRPLFPGEQVQWNDTLGFYRGVRDRVLAVARLDERRILFTATELFECDGPGVDDNGLGEIGAPRRLPSDVGLYGGVLGWRSIVEISAGILFQGLANQLYLLPRGGVTPVAIGFSIEDTLALYPDISAAVYLNDDQTVRFCCNNTGGDESIVLLFNVRFSEWFVEGPYAFAIRAATEKAGQFVMLTSDNIVMRQRTSDTPLSFVDNAWRSGIVHPWKPGMFGRAHAFWFYGTVRGNCRIRCIVTYDERDTETHEWVDVFDREPGSQFVHRFEFDQTKCENVQVDFEISSFQSQATSGLDYTYWAIEGEDAKAPNELGPEGLS